MSEEQVAESSAQNQVASQSGGVAWIKPDGTFDREKMPDGLGEHSMFNDFRTVGDFVKGAVNQNKLLGKKAEEWIMSEDPEITKKRNALMGVPETADGYEYRPPEGFEANEESLKKDLEYLRELGIPKEKAQHLLNYNFERTKEMQSAAENAVHAEYTQAMDELQKEWKDKTEYNFSKAKDALVHLGLDEYANELDSKNPFAVKFAKDIFEKIVPIVDNDEIIAARQNMSLASIEDSLKDVETKIYNCPQEKVGTPEYRGWVAERTELLTKQTKLKK